MILRSREHLPAGASSSSSDSWSLVSGLEPSSSEARESLSFIELYADFPPSSSNSLEEPDYELSQDMAKISIGYSSGARFKKVLRQRGVTEEPELPSSWLSLSECLSQKRNDRIDLNRGKVLVKLIKRSLNENILTFTILPTLVNIESLMLNDDIAVMTNAQWSDIPLETTDEAFRLTAPRPDVTIGLNGANIPDLSIPIESLSPYSCPVIGDPDLLFPVFTLEAKGILQTGFFSGNQNMHNGSLMIRNLRFLYVAAHGLDHCLQFFDEKIFVITTSLTSETVENTLHFCSTEKDRLRFKSAPLGSWLIRSASSWPEIIDNVQNAISKTLSSNREWIVEALDILWQKRAKRVAAATAEEPRKRAKYSYD